jgi:putative nucleotidyltransferase with HDIG domain
MIPTRKQCEKLIYEFNLPNNVIIHSQLVMEVSCFLADKIESAGIKLNKEVIKAAALLHDLDKTLTLKDNANHGLFAANILIKRGMGEISSPIKKHSLSNISSPNTAPVTYEEKIIFYADKICGEKVISLEERAYLWIKKFPQAKKAILNNIVMVAKLENEILSLANITFEDIIEKFNN